MITHPDKTLFPDDGITKGELAAYYESIAPLMIPHIRDRPITMERFPNGIGQKGFIQKDVSKGFPEWLERVEVPKKDGTVHHALVTDTRSLLWIVNQNCITPHVWVSRVPDLYNPDVCVFDLDPIHDDQPDVLRRAALDVRDLLDELGLPSWVKTSGSKGFHILVSLDGKTRIGDVARFAHQVGAAAGPARSGPLDAGVRQSGSRRAHPRGHRPQRLQRDVCGGLRRPAEAWRARVGALHVGRNRTRNRGAADVHAANDGGAGESRGGSVVGDAPAQTVSAPGNREAAKSVEVRVVRVFRGLSSSSSSSR